VMRSRLGIVVSVVLLSMSGLLSVVPVSGASSAPVSVVRVSAVGDIAWAGGGKFVTAGLVRAWNPNVFLALGDEAYEHGSTAEFSKYYNPAYEVLKSVTWPVPGNHEYVTKGAAGYRKYFGVTGVTWWSRRIGGWTVIGLDSEMVSSTDQLKFLRSALTSSKGRPIIVTWHRPRYSSGVHGDAVDTEKWWSVLHTDGDVKLVLWGHDHDYERMEFTRTGVSSLSSFVVGTGGAELRNVSSVKRTFSKVLIPHVYGVLDLSLLPHGFSWKFVTKGGKVLDKGSRSF
jgi:acid phosphatase type 7